MDWNSYSVLKGYFIQVGEEREEREGREGEGRGGEGMGREGRGGEGRCRD